MYQTRKIGVVGQGHVGAHVANSLLMQGIADELYLCDINEAKVTSEVQDLRDSLSFVPYNTKIVNCYDHYEELACCDVIVNAAGKVALAAGNRDGELFEFNVFAATLAIPAGTCSSGRGPGRPTTWSGACTSRSRGSAACRASGSRTTCPPW